ncbi:MAG TPA: YHS domain-containing protein, partial [Terriglobales bacterium]|nr:YHS domain-containing protein [Terriglobales bacterium]
MKAEAMVKDPVCGMDVNPANARASEEYKEQTYYFCCAGCAAKFKADPERVLQAGPKPMRPASGMVQLGAIGHVTHATATAKDPVCGMQVDPPKAAGQVEHGGKTYHFCSQHCVSKFREDPEKYLDPNCRPASMGGAAPTIQIGGAAPGAAATVAQAKPAAKQERHYICPMCAEVSSPVPAACPSCGMALEPDTVAPATRVEYVCPMHPEIVRDAPGTCPICGMALEPRTITSAEEENPELRDMSRRFWVSLALSVPLVALAMLHLGGPFAHF